jgi:hypothetical protein
MITCRIEPSAPDDYLPACDISPADVEVDEQTLIFKHIAGSVVVLKFVRRENLPRELQDYYGIHFRLDGGYQDLLSTGKSYGSLLKPFSDNRAPEHFDDFFSECFVNISIIG